MAIDEQARLFLFEKLQERLGPKAAGTLMELLPPVGWADVATKHDLAALEERMGVRLSGLEERIDLRFQMVEHTLLESFERGLKEQARGIYQVMATTVTGSMVAVASLAFLAARLF